MIDDLNSKVLELESFISNLEERLSYAEKLLKKFKAFDENSMVEELVVIEEFHKYLDEGNESITFLEEKIKFSTMLKTFKKDYYNDYFESFIDENKTYCQDSAGEFYLRSDVESLIEEIEEMIEE